jgi:nitric oxide reductase subunit B
VISWIFTAAQAGVYYYIPRLAKKDYAWTRGPWVHLFLQATVSLLIIACFCFGKFGGREYLEFPPTIGLLVLLPWIPFAINFFGTLRINFKTAPVYFWSWSTGILFFILTLIESYLWVFSHFNDNIVRDITVQWKAMGSMVGSWNMLVYGTAIFIMERINGNTQVAKSRQAFFLYFLGLVNLMFNWGHHTYIVPAAPWVKNVSYFISMTELLILGNIIWQWKKTITKAVRNYHSIPYRLLSFADFWIFLNLALAILISIPAINYYTHGTLVTVAHAMGSTIGINCMLLFASLVFILQQEHPLSFVPVRRWIDTGILVLNFSLLFFWISLIGSGLIAITGKLNNQSFYLMMEACKPWFRVFSFSGIGLAGGFLLLMIPLFKLCLKKPKEVRVERESIATSSLLVPAE